MFGQKAAIDLLKTVGESVTNAGAGDANIARERATLFVEEGITFFKVLMIVAFILALVGIMVSVVN